MCLTPKSHRSLCEFAEESLELSRRSVSDNLLVMEPMQIEGGNVLFAVFEPLVLEKARRRLPSLE